jgi:hypothetical protein
MPILQGWDCLGPGPAHKAEIEHIQTSSRSPNTDVAVRRCDICGQYYQYRRTEVSDWSGDRDYYDETVIWTPLDKDEVGLAGQDSNYRPRSDKSHRIAPGWRAG